MSHDSAGTMSPGSAAAALGAAYLAVGLGMVVYIMLVLEPAMGPLRRDPRDRARLG